MILVTGGTGVMGSVLVRRLVENGNKVRVLTLPDDPHCARVTEYTDDIVFGSVTDRQSVRLACKGVKTIYHLAAVIITNDEQLYEQINYHGTRVMVEEAQLAKVKHFVYVSSASVVYPRPTPYSLSKRAAESVIRQSTISFTIVRPTLVYDEGRGGQEFDMYLDYLRKFPAIPFIGKGLALKRPVFVNDIIEGLVKIHKNKRARGKTYNFSGGESISMIDFTRLCLRLLKCSFKPIIPIPEKLCTVIASTAEKNMKNPPLRWSVIAGVTQDADLDSWEARLDLGYDPLPVSRKLPECFPREKPEDC
ncbi:MAG: NAD-dependent epimerase/dehydratase family protein [Chitinivibrionales bacterium]